MSRAGSRPATGHPGVPGPDSGPGRSPGHPGAAVARAIEAGTTQRAVELLDHERGLLLARTLGAGGSGNDSSGNDRASGDLAAGGAPEPFARLQPAADRGPVVVVNISDLRCDALIITRSGVRVTRLSRLTAAQVTRQAAAFAAALAARQAPGLDREAAEAAIAGTLTWLWDHVAAPLLPDLMAACGEYPEPRVWLCPTGPLTFLPLHAAGDYLRSGEALADRVVSSYTPTLRSLLRVRVRADAREGTAAAPLAVALPRPPGHPCLYAAEREAAEFARWFPDCRQLLAARATVAGITRALRTSPPWCHLCCHGAQDLADPAAGWIQLYDGQLTLRDIAGLRLRPGELAYLSACAATGRVTPQAAEAVTVATAFQMAGYRHVIGTLWFIPDLDAGDLAGCFYEALADPRTGRPDAGRAAKALHLAVQTLRARVPDAPWLWAPYFHLGP